VAEGLSAAGVEPGRVRVRERDQSLVLHVLPVDIARGAQRYARAMRDALDGPRVRHRTLTIFASDSRVLDADVKLGVKQTALRRSGLEPRAAWALLNAIRSLRPDLVITHGSEPLKYATLVVPPRVPIVYYKIGVVHERARVLPRSALHAALLRRAVRIAGVSQECLDECREVFGVCSTRLVLIPNGRDPTVFYPTSSRAKDAVPKLVFIGHLSSSKRPAFFVDVVSSLRRAGVGFEAVMIGEGPLFEALRQRATEAGVVLLGRRDDVPQLLREADVVAFTSVPEGEGMPGVFIEAGLSGVPIVSTDVPGARTVILPGQSGFVVAVNDTDNFVESVGALLVDTDLRRRMGAAARERCLAHFTLEQSVAGWADLVENVLGRRSSTRSKSSLG
jgi:glycosyltransferase involved in cell wall biosynthesis